MWTNNRRLKQAPYFSGSVVKRFCKRSNFQLLLSIRCVLIRISLCGDLQITHFFKLKSCFVGPNKASQPDSWLWITKDNALEKCMALLRWQKRVGQFNALGIRWLHAFYVRLVLSGTVAVSVDLNSVFIFTYFYLSIVFSVYFLFLLLIILAGLNYCCYSTWGAISLATEFIYNLQLSLSWKSVHFSYGRMCISNQRIHCNDVNWHLAILSDECCTQVV